MIAQPMVWLLCSARLISNRRNCSTDGLISESVASATQLAHAVPCPCMDDEILALLTELVRIDSVNPDLVAGGAGEEGVALYILGWCATVGLIATRHDVEPGRPNVIVTVPGTGGGRSLMLNGHTDVVGVAGYRNPFVPMLTRDRLYGRGVLDTKVGVATALVIARRASKVGLAGDLIVTAVVDEECGSKGTEALISSGLRTDAAVVLEPTDLAIVHAHRGWAWGNVTVHGRAAHGSRADLGVDAIVHTAPVLVGLGELQQHLMQRAHPVLGPAGIHSSIITGGAELSTYPDRVVVEIERRNLPGESTETLAGELAALAALVRPPATATSAATFGRAALLVNPSELIITTMQQAAPNLPLKAAAFWTDAALLHEAGIPSVVFGPTGAGIHETEEWLDLDSLTIFANALWQTVITFCGPSEAN